MFDPSYNYHRAIASLRTEIIRLVGGNLADQKQIKDHVAHLRQRIAELKNEFTAGTTERFNDAEIDFANPPTQLVAEQTLIDETGIHQTSSADPGNGMMPEPETYVARNDFKIENWEPKVASSLQSEE